MYQILMYPVSLKGASVKMECLSSLFEADRRARLYSNKNKTARFVIVNNKNGDIEGEYKFIA